MIYVRQRYCHILRNEDVFGARKKKGPQFRLTRYSRSDYFYDSLQRLICLRRVCSQISRILGPLKKWARFVFSPGPKFDISQNDSFDSEKERMPIVISELRMAEMNLLIKGDDHCNSMTTLS